MVPTATLLGLFTTGRVARGVIEVVVTIPLWPITAQVFLNVKCHMARF
jgi:hypothetical protein